MQTWRWTELLQILKVTITGSHSHVDGQVLGEVCHWLDDVFWWHDDSQLISHLRLWLQLLLLLQHGALDMTAEWVQPGHSFFTQQ